MSEISVDFSDFNNFTAKLGVVPSSARSNLRTAAEITARHIKDDWRGKLQGASGLPGLSPAISYDVRSDSSSRSDIEAEIGVDKGRFQGPLGNISEFGTPKTAPRGYGAASLVENVADLERGASIAVEQAEKAAGL